MEESSYTINFQQKNYAISSEVKKRKEFSEREVGLTHPDLSSFIRLNDDGDIEIFAAPGVGIIISAKAKSISFFADYVKVHSKEDGFRWNNYSFNYSASSYVEPTLVKINQKFVHSSQNGANYYLQAINKMEEEQRQTPITILGDYGFSSELEEVPSQNNLPDYDTTGLNEEDIELLEIYKAEYTANHISNIVKLLKLGMTFEQAHQISLREING